MRGRGSKISLEVYAQLHYIWSGLTSVHLLKKYQAIYLPVLRCLCNHLNDGIDVNSCRNQTYSPPTIISVPPTLDNVIIMPLGHIEPSTNAPDSTSEQRPVNDSRQLSNNSNESYYSIHGNDDNNPPDYRHALQYRSTENEEVESSSANQQPPCYDTVN